MSSPWVSGYEIDKTEQTDNIYVYYLTFSTATSTGSAGNYKATLTVAKETDFWRIINIKTDSKLYPYTGSQ